MKSVATTEAKNHLPALLEEVSLGETIVITRRRKPLAKLVRYDQTAARPKVGEMIDKPFAVGDAGLRPMNEGELREWGL